MPGTAFPRAAGKVNIGGSMRYIPSIFSGKMLKKYYDTAVVPGITNTDYEGEIKKYGDTVYIREVPDITIRDYVKGQTVVNEQPEAASQALLIDKGKYWSFVTDDVDDAQTDIKDYVTKWSADAAEQMRLAMDTAVLGDSTIYDGMVAANKGATAGVVSGSYDLGTTGGSAVSLTKTNILEKIVDCGSVLDEQNVPEEGRYLVLPVRLVNLIKKSDIKDASLTGDAKSSLRTGLLGRIDRFTVYTSNLLSSYGSGSSTAWRCLFGINYGITFATQLTQTKVMDNPDGFGKLYRGLIVYGYKMVKPEAVGCLYASVG
jgi:hypothetical protein